MDQIKAPWRELMQAKPNAQTEPRDGSPRAEKAHVTGQVAAASPRLKARITGIVYLLFFLTAVLGEIFMQLAGMSGLGAVSGDAAAAANNLLEHTASFWVGFALGLGSIACYVAVTALLYELFKPVSRSLSLLAVFFSLVGLTIQAFASIFQLAPLILLGDSPYLSVFSARQVQALSLMLLRLHDQAYGIGLVFDGL